MQLQLDQSVKIDVDPAQRYYPTEIEVVSGESYLIIASGSWKDASKVCGPTGWHNCLTPYLLRFSRLPEHDLFYLVGNIGRDEATNFPIGAHAEITINDSGPLFLFANDLWHFYFNNHRDENKPMLVEIRRIS